MKLTVVGGGSTYTPEHVDGLGRLAGELTIDELVLLDPDVAADEAATDEDVALEAEEPEPEAPVQAPPAGASPAGGLETLVSRLRVEPEVQSGYDSELFRHWVGAVGVGGGSRRVE